METETSGKTPRLVENDIPEWWHHHGTKMRVESYDLNNRVLTLKSSAATIIIQPAKILSPSSEHGWHMLYRIECGSDTRFEGRVWMNAAELQAAFCFRYDPRDFGYRSRWLIDEYGADVAVQGKFIRWSYFLNIPGPGTGHDGDANISIKVRPAISCAVDRLFK